MTTYGVIGGGIVGLATAYKLQLKIPGSKVLLFEKEKEIGRHQSGNNSGVLHCGLYYQPGSLKARLAVNGIREMTAFCRSHEINHDICGKVVIASDERESKALEDLYDRGRANGLEGLRYLDDEDLSAREPYVWAHKALLVPQEGIVDYKDVMRKLRELIEANNGEVLTGVRIDHLKEAGDKVVVSNGIEEWQLDRVISCAGLYSDRVYQWLVRKESPIRIVPFRGEYWELKPEFREMVNHLVYPVPDAQYPFLGVHFTRMINGSREVGPNAVFATKREGYSNRDISLKDTFESLSYKGFLKFLRKNFVFSMNEFYTSLSKQAFIAKAQKLIPEIRKEHLMKGSAGVRAQAISEDGALLMDFNVIREGRQVHVLNAPSPGATASLAIADYIISEFV